MTVETLRAHLSVFRADELVVCACGNGGWDNIREVDCSFGCPTLVIGGGPDFIREYSGYFQKAQEPNNEVKGKYK